MKLPTNKPKTRYCEQEFYAKFTADLLAAHSEIVIESPFLTLKRLKQLQQTFETVKKGKVRIVINTKPTSEHVGFMRQESERAVDELLQRGIQVVFTPNLHRKLSVIDRHVIWEGSLNALSHAGTLEMMRRSDSSRDGWELLESTGLADKI